MLDHKRQQRLRDIVQTITFLLAVTAMINQMSTLGGWSWLLQKDHTGLGLVILHLMTASLFRQLEIRQLRSQLAKESGTKTFESPEL